MMTFHNETRSPRPALFQGRTGILAALRKHVNRALGRVSYDVHVVNLARQLTTLGFCEAPLADLADMARTVRDRHARTAACLELAKWHIRLPGERAAALAFDWVREGQANARSGPHRQHLLALEMLCMAALAQGAQAQGLVDKARRARFRLPDHDLAAANLAPDLQTRLARINLALDHFRIPSLILRDLPGLAPYDRLACAAPQPPHQGGPKVSVILAAYEADTMLRTALRSLREQTWQNLEILIVDDASPSARTARIAQEFCDLDPRFRFLRMETNSGAYSARNRALDAATGDLVTLHDADDWSHPRKIETQVAYLQTHARVLGCTSEQARATNELDFQRWSGEGRCIANNVSSFMFRREPMRAMFGYWDTVRVSADNELIRRMRAKFGTGVVEFVRTGPLSFQRDVPSTVTANPVLGINGFRYGARQEYLEAQSLAHRDLSALRYDGRPEARPFPAPGLMLADRARVAATENRFDAIFVTDFRARGQATADALADIDLCLARGLRVAVFSMYRYLGSAAHLHRLEMDTRLRRALWDRQVRILCYGELVQAGLLVVHGPDCCLHPQRYVPGVSAARVALVTADPAPASAACEVLATTFGTAPTLYARDAATLRALADAPAMAHVAWEIARADLPGPGAATGGSGCGSV